MVTDPLEDLLPQLGERLSAQMGLHFPPERWPDLQRAIRSAAAELGFDDIQSCIHELVKAPVTKQQIEILASHLTVGETYFFRDKVCFRILQETVLPELIQARRGREQRLRIWSAGCCTGEEPYSIAILLRQMLPDLADWQVSIMATDINTRFLKKATAGIYSEWSFRDAPTSLKQTSFTLMPDGKMELRPEIRKMVQFTCLNLAEDAFPSLLNKTNALDLIVCRNVLMYFSPEQLGKTINKFYRALVEGGWLILGAAEASPFALKDFQRPAPGVAGFFQKSNSQQNLHQPLTAPECSQTFMASPYVIPTIKTIPHQLPQRVPIPPRKVEIPRPPTLPLESYEQALELYQHGKYPQAAHMLVVLMAGGAGKAGHANFDVKIIALLARVYANQGQLAEAISYCERAIAADKLHAPWYFLRATILQEQGLADQAIGSLKRALYLDPGFVPAHFALGNLYRQLGDEAAAGKHFINARVLLKRCKQEDTLPESDGITAGRLATIIDAMTEGQ